MRKKISLLVVLALLLFFAIVMNYTFDNNGLYTNFYFLIAVIIAFSFSELLIPITVVLGLLHLALEGLFDYNMLYAVVRVLIFAAFSIFLLVNKRRIKTSEEKEIKYDLLFENMPQAFAVHKIVLDEKGRPVDYIFLDVNPAFEEITRLKAKDIIGHNVRELLPNTEDYWIKAYGEVALSGKPARLENYSAELDKYFDVRAFSFKYGEFAVVFSDITNRVKAEKELFESREVFREYIDNAPDGVIILDSKGQFKKVNKSTILMTGYSEAELLTMRTKDITPREDFIKAIQPFEAMFQYGKTSFEVAYVRKNGEKRIWSMDGVKTSDDEAICFVKDITERKALEQKIVYNYYHDSLTGMYNRIYIYDNMQKIDVPKNYPLAFVLADINGLKLINDAFGKDFGDDVIKKIAQLIQKNCGPNDIVARWGGDEFIIISPNANESQIHQMIDQMQSGLSDTIKSDLSVSFGFKIKESREESFEKSLNEAEDMMLRYKTYESSSFRGKTIKMILNTLHEKNQREEQHSKRVSEICESIGRALEFTEAEVGKLKTIGLVHDIGKIGIHESILNKTGKLTVEEWEEMRKHPEIGYRLLSSTNETAELAVHVLAHHERMDGKGYPNGIMGKDISVLTRILTIADSYDAMTASRPYRESMTQEQAIEELYRHSGTQFDPAIIEVFVKKVLPYTNFM